MEAPLLGVLNLLLLAGIESSMLKRSTDEANTRTGISAIRPDTVEEHGSVSFYRHKREMSVIDPFTVKVLRTEENGLWYFDMLKKKSTVIKSFIPNVAFSVDYHYQKHLLFYSHDDKIIREEVFGSDLQSAGSCSVVDQGVDGGVGLAVDWVHDKLYWLSVKRESIECSELDGSARTVLIDNLNNITFLNSLAIDPNEGFMFILNEVSIFRAKLDGSVLTRIALLGSYYRNLRSITVDVQGKHLYYSARYIGMRTVSVKLFRCDYEGKNIQELPLGPGEWNDIFSLTVVRNILYFTNYNDRKVPKTLWSADLTESPLNPVLQYTTDPKGGMWNIKVYHPEFQKIPQGNDDRSTENV